MYDEEDNTLARPNDFIFDPAYWSDRADALRSQAVLCTGQPRFYATLVRHAEDFDRLAQSALKLRQTRSALGRIDPRYREGGNLVSVAASTGPKLAAGDR